MMQRVRLGGFDWAARYGGRRETAIERMTMQS